MLTLQMPTLLALVGTLLMAIVIFAPERVAVPKVSFAPPLAPPPLARWTVSSDELSEPPRTTPAAAWPALVDPRAAGCDVRARLELVDALGTLRAPWARAILQRALDDEPDPAVRAAVTAALGA
jgi:hypothetical protein